jgi:hypothetical protein
MTYRYRGDTVFRRLAETTSYADAAAKAVTTFILPPHAVTGEPTEMALSELMAEMPFHNIEICEEWTMTAEVSRRIDVALGRKPRALIPEGERNGISGFDSVVFIRDSENSLRAVGQSVVRGRISPIERPDDVGFLLQRLVRYLRDRRVRYVEEPLTRQQRRARGVSSEYRRYALVLRDDVRYATALSRREVVRRLRALHMVRGHLRHLSDGRVVPVRPHMRGSLGDATQAKTYVVPPNR